MMIRVFLFRAILAGLVGLYALGALAQTKTYHKDYRKTPKLIIAPQYMQAYANQTKNDGVQMARAYINANIEQFGLSKDLSNLVLSKVKESLTAKHYHFQQMLNGIPVYRAEIIVSISKANGKITKVYNNTYPVSKAVLNQKAVISGDLALTKAWQYLQASGLKATPKQMLYYINEGAHFRLAYKVNLSTKQPFGDWEQIIAADSGKVVRVYRTDLPIRKTANTRANDSKWLPFRKSGQHQSLDQALQALTQKTAAMPLGLNAKADATALLFDPDPRTTLNDDTLEDVSDITEFDAAYVSRTLRDVTLDLDSGTYFLTGDWVSIIDWDDPQEAPSSSGDGSWTARRGDNAFNDVMAYFHIDQNQRYIQSLGFTGSTGIQQRSIEVDTNGADGADQSYFSPSENRLSFGHGCVDDAEDADVILHEYSHAINYDINNNWSGGDTRAMGEGFGDYWAVSYSYSTANGQTFHPEWVFSWDGHNDCWGGRAVNRLNFRYDPNETYEDHEVVEYGSDGLMVLSDELWSTPLAQTLFQLMQDGVPREEVDRIILESQFGLGSGVTMPEMAEAIVATANTLYPGGDHAQTFKDNFELMYILGAHFEVGDVSIITAGDDSTADPGETVTFSIPLRNAGTEPAASISGTVSTTTTGVEVVSATSLYPGIESEEEATNISDYQINIPSTHVCGEDIDLDLQVAFEDAYEKTASINVVLPVGSRSSIHETNLAALPIPDNDASGVDSQITISNARSGSSISVDVNITHTYRGDLRLELTSPSGTTVTLISPSSADSASDIMGSYPDSLTPEESLSAFDGEGLNGTWTLQVVDSAAEDTGTLNSWGINITHISGCGGDSDDPPNITTTSSSDGGGGTSSFLMLALLGLFKQWKRWSRNYRQRPCIV